MASSLGRSGAAKRTLSALLKDLPNTGVGCVVARDTWHPESGKQWQITAVKPKKNSTEHLEAYGFLYYHGERQHSQSKRIASVWKYGWYWREEVGQANSSDAKASASTATPQSGTEEPQLAPLPKRRGLVPLAEFLASGGSYSR